MSDFRYLGTALATTGAMQPTGAALGSAADMALSSASVVLSTLQKALAVNPAATRAATLVGSLIHRSAEVSAAVSEPKGAMTSVPSLKSATASLPVADPKPAAVASTGPSIPGRKGPGNSGLHLKT